MNIAEYSGVSSSGTSSDIEAAQLELAEATRAARRFPDCEHLEAVRRQAFTRYAVLCRTQPRVLVPAKGKVGLICSGLADAAMLVAGVAALGGLAFVLKAF